MGRENSRLPWGILVLLWVLRAADTPAGADEGSVGDRFKGEVLRYEAGFWLWSRLGEGESVFRELGGGRYLAVHEAKTLGVARWITRYRRDVYRSTMGTINRGKRLIPLRFEEDVIIGTETLKRSTTYDYQARKVVVESVKIKDENKDSRREEVDIVAGELYDDPMTAFYNFRAGVYGKIEPGRRFIVRTAPVRGSRKTIRLEVAPQAAADRRRAAEADRKGKDLLVTVQLDKDLVRSLHGVVDTWFSAEGVPISGVARDVLFWGDVYGRLIHRGFENVAAADRKGKKP